jgi:hypothetical protein
MSEVASVNGKSGNVVLWDTKAIDVCHVGTGVAPGGDCTEQLQEAISMAATQGGGTIYFSAPGEYIIKGPVKTEEVLGYKYSGQILFPPRGMNEGRISIRIMGNVPAPKKWDAPPGEPVSKTGVVLVSEATEGYIFDAEPGTGEERGTPPFTNLLVTFENITLRAPNNPQCGAINAYILPTFAANQVFLDVNVSGNETKLPTGSNAALVTPHYNNGAYVRLSSLHIVGYPIGINHSEHTYLDYVTINSCAVALKVSAFGYHMSVYSKVLTAKCPTVLQAITTGKGGGTIRGTIDAEVSTEGEFALKRMVDDKEKRLSGDLAIFCLKAPTKGWPTVGGQNLNLANVNFGAVGWFNAYPLDTFTRVLDVPEVVGCCDRTCHLWGVVEGKATTENPTEGTAVVKSSESAANTMLTVRYYLQVSAGSRIIYTTLTTGLGAYNVQQIVGRIKNGDYLSVKLNGGIVSINKSVGSTTTHLVSSAEGVVKENTPYKVVTKVYNEPGSAWRIIVLLDGEQVVSYTLNATDVEQLAEVPGELLSQDGLRFSSDNKSSVSYFAVIPASCSE